MPFIIRVISGCEPTLPPSTNLTVADIALRAVFMALYPRPLSRSEAKKFTQFSTAVTSLAIPLFIQYSSHFFMADWYRPLVFPLQDCTSSSFAFAVRPLSSNCCPKLRKPSSAWSWPSDVALPSADVGASSAIWAENNVLKQSCSLVMDTMVLWANWVLQ